MSRMVEVKKSNTFLYTKKVVSEEESAEFKAYATEFREFLEKLEEKGIVMKLQIPSSEKV